MSVTHRAIYVQFMSKKRLSMLGLARKFGMTRLEVEAVIRKYMKRGHRHNGVRKDSRKCG